MRDRQLYSQILGIQTPWSVSDVELSLNEGQVTVYIEHNGKKPCKCSTCGKPCPGYDHIVQKWRHLDTCQFQTILVASVPRSECPEHGVLATRVPWSEPGSRYTALFEALVIDWLKEATIKAVAQQMKLSWNAIDGIQQRAVKRGLERREVKPPKRIAVDETSFQKRHEYVTVVTDHIEGVVVHVADDRKSGSLNEYFDTLPEEQKADIECVTMDMSKAYIKSVMENVPEADQRIAFDKFHVAQSLGKAVNKVRVEEHKTLMSTGVELLKGTRFDWLTNPKNMSDEKWDNFEPLRNSTLKTARAWAIREMAMSLWDYKSRAWAIKAWKRWLSWAQRCRLEPIKEVARTVKAHLWGIVNAIVLNANNGRAEGINSKIQSLKNRACGYRSRERYKTAIYFHLGGLDLYPCGVKR